MTTYKVMLGLLWTSSKCSPATKFIVKMDDNSVVDLARLEKALDEVDEGSEENIFCPYQMRGLPVWRHTQAKLQNAKSCKDIYFWPKTFHFLFSENLHLGLNFVPVI